MLKIKNLNVTYNKGEALEKKVLSNFNLDVNEGDFICILGSNGAGKSSLFNSIIGNIAHDGEIIFNGKLLKEKQYKRMKDISIVYQDPKWGTCPNLTIYENIMLATKKKTFFNKEFKNLYETAINDLKEFNIGLENNLKQKCDSLSGGMRQALSLYMAKLSNPKLLLLDEHTAALDPITQDKIMHITNDIVNKNKITTLMITHDLKTALKYGNRLIILGQGNVILDIKDEEKRKMTEEKLLSSYQSHLSDRTIL